MGPRNARERLESNLAALRTLRTVQEAQRPATPAEQETLARWTSWGALKDVFDEQKATYASAREELSDLLSDSEFRQARRTILNAHYTDPRLVDALWAGVTGLGFPGGHVLEPGAGAGTFIGLAPESARMVGVELDAVSADIAATLFPSAVIRHESFADTHLPESSFAAAVGNVPFGDYALHDRLHNPARHSIHNHFILKSLDLVRPGGMVAVLTSRFTLDAANPAARRDLWDRADLVTAIRLPSDAHQDLAGTSAVTDLLVLRVRPEGEPARDNAWLAATRQPLPDAEGIYGETTLNAWWDLNPHLVLGRSRLGTGMHGSATLHVDAAPGDLATQLRAVLSAEVRRAVGEGLGFGADPAAAECEAQLAQLAATARSATVAEAGDPSRFEGFLSWDPGAERFTTLVSGVPTALEVPSAQLAPLRSLLALRDTQITLLETEAASEEDSADLAGTRERLNDLYDAHVARYGPINSVKVTESSRLDRNGDPVITRRKPAVMRVFDNDPFSGAVRGLEIYDEETDTAAKAAVFTRRVVNRAPTPTSADSPADALSIVLDTYGEVRLPEVARLLGTEDIQAREQLGDLVFDDPASDRLVPRAAYLSGNVRKALQAAEEAMLERPELKVNVAALRKVIPRDLTPAEIQARLGAVWVPAEDVESFLQSITKDRRVRVEHPGGAHWNVRGGDRATVAATSTWGTERLNVFVIAERLMQQKPIVVTDAFTDADGRERRVVNPVETAAAQEKAEQLQERFGEWVWADPDRSQRLCRIYNDTFNALALRDYTEDGQRLRLPGLAATFTPHAHQRTAVARMIAEPSVGLYHGVGAGKTAEMVMGAMELRRLGLVDKPCVVVPNHMLEQVSREWMQLYPRARLLAASSEDLRGDRRRHFVGRAAMGDWDGIVLTHKAFELLPVDKRTEVDYIQREVDQLRKAKERARATEMSNHTIRQIERAVAAKEQQLQNKLDRPRDRGLTFEQTGIDYLIVDELHLFKNLTVASNIQDMNRNGSLRASDLDMKVAWLRERAGEGGRVITGATATPIANSVSEAWVMQRYLRPDLLEDAGITDFDSWAGTFGTLVTDLEMTPEGGYRQKTRFARFDNLPELLRMWHISADVRTADQLNLPIPAIATRTDGQRAPETVVVPASPELTAFMGTLAERAERLRNASAPRGKGEDNMLVVSSDGRKAALDLRMLDRSFTDPIASTTSKVDVAAQRIHGIWLQHRFDTFPLHPGSDDDRRHPSPGGLQIVFGDLGTPSANPAQPWSFYTELRAQLTARGMDPSRIRFVQDANSTEKKARLFAACRDGQVDVLVGSTETMGVGTNVQLRAVALHHMDCPWRPADVEQREGRILRQGNTYDQVQILRYVTEGSFDAFSWQTVERKQRFISQMMNGSTEIRGAEDLASGQALSYSEVKALASGNPLILERAAAEQEATKLERLSRAHARNQQQLAAAAKSGEATAKTMGEQLPRIERLIAERVDTHGDAFTAAIGGQRVTDRARAAELLAELAAPAAAGLEHRTPGYQARAGRLTIGRTDFDLVVMRTLGETHLVASMTLLPERQVMAPLRDVLAASVGPIQRLENRVHGLDTLLEETQYQRERALTEAAEAVGDLGAPFPREVDLKAARSRLETIDAQLAAMEEGGDSTESPAAGPPARGSGPATDSTESPMPAGLTARERYDLELASLRLRNAARRTEATRAAAANADPPREDRVTERPQPTRPTHGGLR